MELLCRNKFGFWSYPCFSASGDLGQYLLYRTAHCNFSTFKDDAMQIEWLGRGKCPFIIYTDHIRSKIQLLTAVKVDTHGIFSIKNKCRNFFISESFGLITIRIYPATAFNAALFTMLQKNFLCNRIVDIFSGKKA